MGGEGEEAWVWASGDFQMFVSISEDYSKCTYKIYAYICSRTLTINSVHGRNH